MIDWRRPHAYAWRLGTDPRRLFLGIEQDVEVGAVALHQDLYRLLRILFLIAFHRWRQSVDALRQTLELKGAVRRKDDALDRESGPL